MKSHYEARASDEDEEGGETPSDDDEGRDNKSNSGSDRSSSNSGDSEDDSNSNSDRNNSEGYDSQYSGNDRGEPLSDRKDEDVGLFYEDHFDDDVEYYDGDIEDDAEAGDIDTKDGIEAEDQENDLEVEGEDVGGDVEVEDEEVEEATEAEGIDYDDYPYGWPSDWNYIIDVSSRLGPQYDKHGREILELGSFHNSKLGLLTPYTKEEDDIDARLATLDKKLMIHSFRNLTLESFEGKDERMEVNKSKWK